MVLGGDYVLELCLVEQQLGAETVCSFQVCCHQEEVAFVLGGWIYCYGCIDHNGI